MSYDLSMFTGINLVSYQGSMEVRPSLYEVVYLDSSSSFTFLLNMTSLYFRLKFQFDCDDVLVLLYFHHPKNQS